MALSLDQWRQTVVVVVVVVVVVARPDGMFRNARFPESLMKKKFCI
jgi:branched-subunit amino acid ABC-type transport system permease component